MNTSLPRGGGIIVLSFVAAMAMQIMPLPDFLAMLRPDWVVMVLIYWCMALPQRIGVGMGWMTGLVMDVLLDSLLGQHALTMAIIAYLTLNLHQRIRVFPLWQQGITVMILLIFQAALTLWINGMVGKTVSAGLYLLPAITSALAWPAVFLFMRHLRRRYQVN